MTDISSTITIEALVHKALLKLPEDQRMMTNKRRFFEFAIDGLRYLYILTAKGGKKEVKTTPSSIDRIDFPSDCEEVVEVGVPVNGKFWPLTRDNDMITTTTVSGIDTTLDASDGEGVALPTSQIESFTSRGGVNSQGYYTTDERNREIIVSSNIRSEVILRYITSGISNISISYIPTKFSKAMEAYILWQDIEHNMTIPERLRMAYERAYLREERKIKRIQAPTLSELWDAWSYKNNVRG